MPNPGTSPSCNALGDPWPRRCGCSPTRSNAGFQDDPRMNFGAYTHPLGRASAQVRVPSLWKELPGRQAHAQSQSQEPGLAWCPVETEGQLGSGHADRANLDLRGSRERVPKLSRHQRMQGWMGGQARRASEGTQVEGPGREYSRERPGSRPEGEGCPGSSAMGTQGHGDNDDAGYLATSLYPLCH